MPEEKSAPISLASLMTPSKTVSIDYPGYDGFKVDLCHLAREELLNLRKSCIGLVNINFMFFTFKYLCYKNNFIFFIVVKK